jgi:hypothetical protein
MHLHSCPRYKKNKEKSLSEVKIFSPGLAAFPKSTSLLTDARLEALKGAAARDISPH